MALLRQTEARDRLEGIAIRIAALEHELTEASLKLMAATEALAALHAKAAALADSLDAH